MIVGYRRVSSADQSLDRQDLGQVDRLFEDKISGKDRDRPGLATGLAFVREGDTFRVHSADRLARSLKDLLAILDDLTQRGVTVELLKEGMVFDPSTEDPYQRCMLAMLGAFAELERDLIRSRQREGIALAKQKGGVYKGRSAALRPEQVRVARQRRRDGVTLSRLMADYGVSRSCMTHALNGTGVYAAEAYC